MTGDAAGEAGSSIACRGHGRQGDSSEAGGGRVAEPQTMHHVAPGRSGMRGQAPWGRARVAGAVRCRRRQGHFCIVSGAVFGLFFCFFPSDGRSDFEKTVRS